MRAVFTALSPIPWLLFHPASIDHAGAERHSLMQFGEFYVDTRPRVPGRIGARCHRLLRPALAGPRRLPPGLLTIQLLSATVRDRRARGTSRIAFDPAQRRRGILDGGASAGLDLPPSDTHHRRVPAALRRRG